MNIIRNTVLLFLAVAAITACKEDKLTVYESDTRIYFSWAENTYSGTKSVEFSHLHVYFGSSDEQLDEITISIPVTIMGRQAGYDRQIAFDVDFEYVEEFVDQPYSDVIVGTDIEYMLSYVPANSSYGEVIIKMHNNDRLDEASAQGLSFAVRLLENEHFLTDHHEIMRNQIDSVSIKKINPETGEEEEVFKQLRYNSTYTLVNYNSMPGISVMWQDVAEGSTKVRMIELFGEYSRGRLDFICDVLGFPRDFFDPDLTIWNHPLHYWRSVSNENAPMIGYMWSSTVVDALNAYYFEYGHYPYDENGEEIKPVARVQTN